MAQAAYDRAIEIGRQVFRLQSIGKLLSWDQSTNLPTAGAAPRAEQRALIDRLLHERLVSEELQEILEELGPPEQWEVLGPSARANLRELRRSQVRQRRIPTTLVDELSRTMGLAQAQWLDARKKNDFELFAPWLEKLVRLSREVAQAVGFESEPYDALLDDHEPGLRAKDFLPILSALGDALRELTEKLAAGPRRADTTLLQRPFDADKLRSFTRRVVTAIGFDFHAGRMDAATHSFCSGVDPRDVRLVAGFNPNNPLDSLFATIHEAGHGLYHQGIAEEHWSTPIGRGASVGVHESQARWWENFLARSAAFWRYFFPHLQSQFPDSLDGVSTDGFHRAINDVRPSLIRVEADEVTYNLHISVRVELERAMINDDLAIRDLPNAWNDLMEARLGIRPTSARDGVLQDVHWSQGMFGYFPTYTLGNIYAAQLDFRMRQETPDLDERASRGDFIAALDWMRSQIQKHGALYSPAELVNRACQEPVSAERLVDYLRAKFLPLYGL